jgi:WD40 repeat protein
MNTKEKKYSILHSEGVSSIKWRPKHGTQIAASSSNSLIIWDYKRPFVPYALFDSNKYTSK